MRTEKLEYCSWCWKPALSPISARESIPVFEGLGRRAVRGDTGGGGPAGKCAALRLFHRICGQMRRLKFFFGALSERHALKFLSKSILFQYLTRLHPLRLFFPFFRYFHLFSLIFRYPLARSDITRGRTIPKPRNLSGIANAGRCGLHPERRGRIVFSFLIVIPQCLNAGAIDRLTRRMRNTPVLDSAIPPALGLLKNPVLGASAPTRDEGGIRRQGGEYVADQTRVRNECLTRVMNVKSEVRSEDLFADRRGRYYAQGRRMRRRHFSLKGLFQQPRIGRVWRRNDGVREQAEPEEERFSRPIGKKFFRLWTCRGGS